MIFLKNSSRQHHKDRKIHDFCMQLLEFQAKELFREYGINLLDSISSTNIEEGRKHAKQLGFPFVIKIQVPVGGRGKAGGIQKCQNEEIEHESWFLELIYGRPSGHMRRKYAGERPHTRKHSRSLDMD